jgi:putative transposase
MVAAVRAGASLRQTARRFGVSLSTLQAWLQRARGQRLDRVDWSDRPRGPHHPPRRTATDVEELIVILRRQLRQDSDLGEYGAEAIYQALLDRGIPDPPVPRTIHRILRRHGLLDVRLRVRRPPPPRGWYLPDVAAGRAELDSLDMVEGLALEGGIEVQVLTAISLHGGLVGAWPMTAVTAKTAAQTVLEHWREVGLPDYAQFDNDTRFQGPRLYPDSLGRVIRLCLSLGVTPVFVPPVEMGFQAAIESFNGRWQSKVWARFHHADLEGLAQRSARYVAASRRRAATRIETAPARRPLPADWRLNWQTPLAGRVLFLRRTDGAGSVSLLGHSFRIADHWVHRLIRAEVDLDSDRIRFYALRRREPGQQPLLREVTHRVPRKRFRE